MSNEQNNASPIAYLTEDGERCITAKTYNTARNDGGAIWSTMRPFCVPAYATPPAAPAVPDTHISVQEAWEAAGGNPGIKASKADLIIALKTLDTVCDEADAAPAVPQGFKPVGYLRSDEFDGHVFEPIDGTWPFDELLFSLSTSPEPAVPQGEPVYQLARATGPVADAWIDVAKDVYDDAGFYPSDFKRRILYAAPSQEPAVPQGWTDADSDAARLALELECLLLDTENLSVVSKWWASANEALELHRRRLATPAAPSQEPYKDSTPHLSEKEALR